MRHARHRSAVGGIKFSVLDGETGYLVPPRDQGAVADRVAHLYHRPELLDSFGTAAHRRAVRHFTWKHVADALERVYVSVVEHASRERPRERRTPPIGSLRVDRLRGRRQPALAWQGVRVNRAVPERGSTPRSVS